MNRIIKRLVVGRPVSSHEEAHHRLSKRIALAVFSSDALSSSAYATDEILSAFVKAGNAAAALPHAVPIGVAVALVLAVVIMSYRQTVRAYSKGGGAYIVAHKNLGKYPGLIAAAALLIDYVLTVSVSVAAGMAAVAAAFPGTADDKVVLSLVIVAVITFLNLRGLKESGSIFAIPTYGFLITMGIMIAFGVVRAFSGQPIEPAAVEHASTAASGAGIFLLLKAFAAGCTALTGVEAISDGVPAFQKPEAKNASQTLGVLGILLAILFLGVTFLARTYQIDPHGIEQGRTVTSQIASRVFTGGLTPMFYVVQAFTALILFLAANTAYADFPRLASILARDRYLPRALQNRGDRLAFSNGIVILALAASLLLYLYDADIHKIVALYVIGVFTSFTLSQTGMIFHWRNEVRRSKARNLPEPANWRRSTAINAIGATTTFIVLLIVSVTKGFWATGGNFGSGAELVMILIPLVALLLAKVNSHYRSVAKELRIDHTVTQIERNRVVMVVSRFRGATKALAFARAIGARQLRVVSIRASEVRIADLANRWSSMGVNVPIEKLRPKTSALIEAIRAMEPTEANPITVVLPDPQYEGFFEQLVKSRVMLGVKRALLGEPGVIVISVPFRPDIEPEPKRLQAPGRLSMIVVVSSVHKATIRALEYARSLNPSDLKALTVQTETSSVSDLSEEWAQWGLDVPLEIVDSPYRSLIEPLVREVRELGPNPNDAVGVVVPEFVVSRWWQNLLHNQTALLIKTTLLFEPNVVVISVPYRIGAKKKALSSRRP